MKRGKIFTSIIVMLFMIMNTVCGDLLAFAMCPLAGSISGKTPVYKSVRNSGRGNRRRKTGRSLEDEEYHMEEIQLKEQLLKTAITSEGDLD